MVYNRYLYSYLNDSRFLISEWI